MPAASWRRPGSWASPSSTRRACGPCWRPPILDISAPDEPRPETTMRKITKAVFPVAGLGSRFLPVTKASPKEMLPIVDKPLIQYAVEEAAAAGITDMIFVTGRNKRAIEDHFDLNPELESSLVDKPDLLALARSVLPAGCRCI